MLSVSTKFFFIFVSCLYFYCKLLNIKVPKKSFFIFVLFSAIIQIPLYFIHEEIPIFLAISIIIILFCSTTFIFNTPIHIAFSTSIISYGFAYVTFLLGTVIFSPIGSLFLSKICSGEVFYALSFLCIGTLQLIINTIPFRVKRLKKGMPFLQKEGTASLGVALGITIITATMLVALKIGTNKTLLMAVFVFIVGFVTIYWWRKTLTQSYVEKLRIKEIESLEAELTALKTENEELAKIIHKDNKLIPAMEMSVRELLSNPSKELASSILAELEKLSKERKGTLLTVENSNQPSTGIIRVDALIKYMNQKCISCGIQFDFSFNCDILHMLNKVIGEDSFTTLIADLLENAIIATKEQSVKKILFDISLKNNTYHLSFFDSGIHFDRNVILNLGKNKITTHAETGGSGIGMMSTMDIVRRHKGTFKINDELDSDIFTKQILITFSYVS